MIRSIVAVLALAILMPPIFAAHARAQNGDVAVIVNPNNSVTNLSLAELRRIFAGERHVWPGGTQVKLIVRAPGSHERGVLLRLMGMSESEYKQYWTAQIFRGNADVEPLSIPSFGMVKEAAVAFPGAIGLVDAHDLKPGMYLKVLKIDQHMPGEAGYPLH